MRRLLFCLVCCVSVSPAVYGADGRVVDGMLLFYGWKDKDAPEAKAFLLDEEVESDPIETSSAHK